jgi:hypothetical protein
MYDTIIIGAGMSGLAAGIRLAYYDQRVCILERHYTIGGLNSFYRLRGRDYDVGLHALTNFTPKGTKTGPLARLLRQLRFRWDDFAIAPQLGSEIAFPGVRLRFDNDPQTLRDEVAWAFPGEADHFDRLTREIVEYDDLTDAHSNVSAREVVGSIIGEPLLVEMLFCPLMFYGSAREDDMDWGQFSIMFRSIFLEGLGRPQAGVRLILKHLTGRRAPSTQRRKAARGRKWPRNARRVGKRRGARSSQRGLIRRLVRNHAALRRRSARGHLSHSRPAQFL